MPRQEGRARQPSRHTGETATTDASIGTPEQHRDPDDTPSPDKAVPPGLQHVPAMFASEAIPAIIVAGAAGIGFGPVGGRLAVVQGAGFAFLPVVTPAVAGMGRGRSGCRC